MADDRVPLEARVVARLTLVRAFAHALGFDLDDREAHDPLVATVSPTDQPVELVLRTIRRPCPSASLQYRAPVSVGSGVRAAAVGAAAVSVFCLGARAEPPLDSWRGDTEGGFQAFLHRLKTNRLGSLYVKLRPRYEHADIQGFRRSNAATLRGVLGFGSRTWKGLSFLVEGEGIGALDTDWYFDGTGSGPGNRRSLVPDPTDIGLNQGYVNYEQTDWTTNLRLGRQRLILDDARFIGNVGWRQNEQTYDAARLSTGLGSGDLHLTYAFLGQVLRIFGDKSPSANRDFESTSHLVNLRWSGVAYFQPVVFAYLLDFDNSSRNSSNSYGTRLIGALDFEPWSVEYSASYAWQTDAAGNSVDYDAHYAWVQAAVAHERAGSVGAGFELLGSDDGDAVFGTPLGTLHTFNGYADAFLDNGGPDGLRDLFVRFLPQMPWRLDGELAFHHFWADESRRRLGWEIDAVLSRPITRYVTLLAKTAYFESTDASRRDTLRVWMQLTFEF